MTKNFRDLLQVNSPKYIRLLDRIDLISQERQQNLRSTTLRELRKSHSIHDGELFYFANWNSLFTASNFNYYAILNTFITNQLLSLQHFSQEETRLTFEKYFAYTYYPVHDFFFYTASLRPIEKVKDIESFYTNKNLVEIVRTEQKLSKFYDYKMSVFCELANQQQKALLYQLNYILSGRLFGYNSYQKVRNLRIINTSSLRMQEKFQISSWNTTSLEYMLNPIFHHQSADINFLYKLMDRFNRGKKKKEAHPLLQSLFYTRPYIDSYNQTAATMPPQIRASIWAPFSVDTFAYYSGILNLTNVLNMATGETQEFTSSTGSLMQAYCSPQGMGKSQTIIQEAISRLTLELLRLFILDPQESNKVCVVIVTNSYYNVALLKERLRSSYESSVIPTLLREKNLATNFDAITGLKLSKLSKGQDLEQLKFLIICYQDINQKVLLTEHPLSNKRILTIFLDEFLELINSMRVSYPVIRAYDQQGNLLTEKQLSTMNKKDIILRRNCVTPLNEKNNYANRDDYIIHKKYQLRSKLSLTELYTKSDSPLLPTNWIVENPNQKNKATNQLEVVIGKNQYILHSLFNDLQIPYLISNGFRHKLKELMTQTLKKNLIPKLMTFASLIEDKYGCVTYSGYCLEQLVLLLIFAINEREPTNLRFFNTSDPELVRNSKLIPIAIFCPVLNSEVFDILSFFRIEIFTTTNLQYLQPKNTTTQRIKGKNVLIRNEYQGYNQDINSFWLILQKTAETLLTQLQTTKQTMQFCNLVCPTYKKLWYMPSKRPIFLTIIFDNSKKNAFTEQVEQALKLKQLPYIVFSHSKPNLLNISTKEPHNDFFDNEISLYNHKKKQLDEEPYKANLYYHGSHYAGIQLNTSAIILNSGPLEPLGNYKIVDNAEKHQIIVPPFQAFLISNSEKFIFSDKQLYFKHELMKQASLGLTFNISDQENIEQHYEFLFSGYKTFLGPANTEQNRKLLLQKTFTKLIEQTSDDQQLEIWLQALGRILRINTNPKHASGTDNLQRLIIIKAKPTNYQIKQLQKKFSNNPFQKLAYLEHVSGKHSDRLHTAMLKRIIHQLDRPVANEQDLTKFTKQSTYYQDTMTRREMQESIFSRNADDLTFNNTIKHSLILSRTYQEPTLMNPDKKDEAPNQ